MIFLNLCILNYSFVALFDVYLDNENLSQKTSQPSSSSSKSVYQKKMLEV